MKRTICSLLAGIFLLLAHASLADNNAQGTWADTVYKDPSTGITFTLPEGWIHDDEMLSPGPMMDVIVSDESGANAIAIACMDSSTIVQLIPSDILGPYGKLIENSMQMLSERMILELFTSAITGNDANAKTQIEEVMVGNATYVMLRSDMNGSALLQCILLRIEGAKLSVLMFSSSSGMETEQFLAWFS